MNNKNVVILGGAGVVGSFMGTLYTSHGYSVRSIDTCDARASDHITQDCLKIADECPDILDWAEIIVFALPEDVASDCLRALADSVDPDRHSLINTCSAQLEFHNLVRSLCPDCETVGVNPMFSPTLECEGRPVILCEDTSSDLGSSTEELLAHGKMNVVRLTPAEHDELMALCQGLPHALILAFLFNIPMAQEKLASLLDIAPPPMQTLMALAARIAEGSPSTYWGIQKHNRSTLRVLEHIQESIAELRRWIQDDAEDEFNSEILRRRTALDSTIKPYAEKCADIFSLLKKR